MAKKSATKPPTAESKEPKKQTKSSSSSLKYVAPLLAIAVAVGAKVGVDNGVFAPAALDAATRTLQDAGVVANESSTVAAQEESHWPWESTSTDVLPDKYESDLVRVHPRSFVTSEKCSDEAYKPETLFNGEIFPVTQPMDGKVDADKVFFLLNGRNEGVYVAWNGQFECIARAADLAATWLGADRDVMGNGVRLYSQMGMPVRNSDELAATNNIVHILLDFQIWVWPGIKKGYTYTLENGVTLTTVGMVPKVFDVQHFLSQEEADKIIELGLPGLTRSKVDSSNSSKVVSGSRTSHTAFVDDGFFTRDFRRRSAQVARLPSPSYAERLQLVKYGAGEFYRQHLDTFHSREFLPNGANGYSFDDYKVWTNWAAEKLRGLDQESLPADFREGGKLFPNAEDAKTFPNAILNVFYESANSSNLFSALFDTDWATWIRSNVDKNAVDTMTSLLEKGKRPNYLPMVVKAWEAKLGRPELFYTFPKSNTNGVSHFFQWVRWAKERVTHLGSQVPSIARPNGELFPKFTVAFQEKLTDIIMDDYSEQFITRLTNVEWYAWLVENRGRNHVLIEILRAFPYTAELAIKAWESRVNSPLFKYKMPKYVKHFHPQRFTTLFLYLNNQTKIGGETVFPFSLDRYNDEVITRTGMDECSQGLAVPPLGLHASLFYVQTPEGDVDKMSRHGGCPPHEGVKWGSNSFMWDSDADEGADLWTTK